MHINLTSEQEAHIASLAARNGRSIDDVVEEALTEWADHAMRLAEFRATLDDALDSIARGEGIEITQESMHTLAEDVKKRGRERLASKSSGA